MRARTLQALQFEGYSGHGEVTILSDGAGIMKRLPGAPPKPTTYIIDRFHLAMKIRPMQQIADHMFGSPPILCRILAAIDEEIAALKWKLWHERIERAVCALELIIADIDTLGHEGDLSAARLNSPGQQLLTTSAPIGSCLSIMAREIARGAAFRPAWLNPRSIPWLRKGWSKASKCAGRPRALISCRRFERLWRTAIDDNGSGKSPTCLRCLSTRSSNQPRLCSGPLEPQGFYQSQPRLRRRATKRCAGRRRDAMPARRQSCRAPRRRRRPSGRVFFRCIGRRRPAHRLPTA